MTAPRWDRAPWTNWSEQIDVAAPERHYYPSSRADLVAIVQEAERAERRVRASGSHWAFADVAVADWLVETNRLTATLTEVLPDALDPEATVDDGHLVHVEAGVTIRDLNLRLDGRNPAYPTGRRRALATMGGASGQTILGAIATGTHGGDHALPPLADLVRAVHLVGPGGIEHWIERDEPITRRDVLERLVPGVEVHHDSALLDAVLVAVGRAGIVYSVVLEVVDQFWLLVELAESTWEDTRGEFLAPFSAFDQPRPDGGGPANRAVEVSFGLYPEPDGRRTCWVTRRWEVAEGQGPPPPPPSRDFFARLCAHRRIFVVAGPSLGDVIAFLINSANSLYLGWVVRRLATQLLGAFRRTQRYADVGYEVMDLNEFGGDCYRGVSLEVALDAADDAPIAYLDEVLFPTLDDFAGHGVCFAGYVSLRFAHRSRALLAMHRWDLTGTIEIALLGGLHGSTGLMQRLQVEAVRRGGTVHWGQVNTTTAADVNRMFPDLAVWQRALGRVGLQPDDVFDNDFCARRGLEPSTHGGRGAGHDGE